MLKYQGAGFQLAHAENGGGGRGNVMGGGVKTLHIFTLKCERTNDHFVHIVHRLKNRFHHRTIKCCFKGRDRRNMVVEQKVQYCTVSYF